MDIAGMMTFTALQILNKDIKIKAISVTGLGGL
jgi:hypothetical protein